jgi:hypothetical protein
MGGRQAVGLPYAAWLRVITAPVLLAATIAPAGATRFSAGHWARRSKESEI